MMCGVTSCPPVGSWQEYWIVFWAWFNFGGLGSILGFVAGCSMVAMMWGGFRPKRLANLNLEWWWGAIPVCIIILLDIPNLVINYVSHKNPFPAFGAKVLGHQWFWEYELEFLSDIITYLQGMVWWMLEAGSRSLVKMLDMLGKQWEKICNLFLVWDIHNGFHVDSYEKKSGVGIRGGDVDTRLVLPADTPCRLVCSGDDVIHNFNIKSLGISVDCVPGRLNQHKLETSKVGVFSGLCSELCGLNHPHMPCLLECIPYFSHLTWLNSMLC